MQLIVEIVQGGVCLLRSSRTGAPEKIGQKTSAGFSTSQLIHRHRFASPSSQHCWQFLYWALVEPKRCIVWQVVDSK